MGLAHFDSWAATFGETVTGIEFAPEGTGYRAKTRFARFFNLPELISVFKEVADVQTSDMLDLPIPEAEYINVVLNPPTRSRKTLWLPFAERAEKTAVRPPGSFHRQYAQDYQRRQEVCPGLHVWSTICWRMTPRARSTAA